jgi:hypothetical protein
LRRPAVVGVPVVDGVAKHHVGLVAANGGDERQLVLAVVAEEAIRQAQVLTNGYAQDFAGCRRFGRPNGGRAARAKLAPGEVDDAHALARGHAGQQGAGAGHFHVVGVGA